MSAVIRLARVEDAVLLPEVERSAGALFRTLPELAWIADDAVSADDHLEAIADATAWVAEASAGPIGLLAAEAVGEDLHIWEVAVHADHQGRGVGRALVETACAHARATGRGAVTLTTFRDVAWNGPFYARLGFVILAPAALCARLAAILDAEVAAGLPRARRCAMRLALT